MQDLIERPTVSRIYLVLPPLTSLGFIALLRYLVGIEICGQTFSTAVALDKIPKLTPMPDLVVSEIELGGHSGIALLKQLKQICPTIRVLFLSRESEETWAQRAMHAGGCGFISEFADLQSQSKDIIRALRGDLAYSETSVKRALRWIINHSTPGAGPFECLSDRELEVFNNLGRGMSTREVSEALCLSIKTVESHRAHIKEKLGLKNASELVRAAVSWVQST